MGISLFLEGVLLLPGPDIAGITGDSECRTGFSQTLSRGDLLFDSTMDWQDRSDHDWFFLKGSPSGIQRRDRVTEI